jgi:hypothetical protein
MGIYCLEKERIDSEEKESLDKSLKNSNIFRPIRINKRHSANREKKNLEIV